MSYSRRIPPSSFRHHGWRELLLAVSAAALCIGAALAGEPPSAADFHATVGVFVKRYCIKCHGGPEPKGELALDSTNDLAAMLKDRAAWEQVVDNLRQGVMPPDGNELPPADAVGRVVGWINERFAEADRRASPNPGRVTMRRLNRVEYNNTIRDLLAVDFRPADDFPSDDVGYGFDNIGDVLSISPLLAEKYLAAAERIAEQAIVTNRALLSAARGGEEPGDAGPPPLPESHRRIITTAPQRVEGVASDAEWNRAAREVLANFASRAYRRPATDEEVARLIALVRAARDEGDSFEAAIQVAVQAVLVSPHFLFRVELDDPAVAAATAEEPGGSRTEGMIAPLTDYQLASRLSYFLWSSMPDDALFAEVKAGTLRDPQHWEAQVRRLLADPKAQALVENFAGQWLQLRNLQTVHPDRQRFPQFDEALRQAMQRETELFFSEIVRQDRSVLDLLDADFTFVNGRLASHYGIEGIEGDQFRRVTVDRSQRGGVLTQASVLTVTSNPTRTSPVKRGKWILEQIFDSPPPPPPADVPELADDAGQPLSGTLRQRMQQHRADPNCAACHQRMDPIGFGLENYDAIGGYRQREGEFPIDPSGELPDGSKFSGPAELKQIFRSKAHEFRLALAAKMLTYALGRGVEPFDRPALAKIAGEVADDGDRFSRLIVAVTQSQPFQMRQASSAAASDRSQSRGDQQ